MPPPPMLSELPETAAHGEIAAIFAELRRLSATPVVALIFRHLATYPGLIEEIWAALRPLMLSGAVQETAWRIAEANVPDDLVPDLGADVRAALGIDEAALGPLLRAIEAYNRANPINLLVMLTLLRRVTLGAADVVPPPARAWTPPPVVGGPLSPMMAPDAMPPHVRRLVNDIGFGDRTALDAVVPSLLRHIAGNPPLLAALHVAIRPRFADGTLSRLTGALHTEMTAAADHLACQLAPLPRLAGLAGVQATMREFTEQWIPLMTIVGPALSRALAAAR